MKKNLKRLLGNRKTIVLTLTALFLLSFILFIDRYINKNTFITNEVDYISRSTKSIEEDSESDTLYQSFTPTIKPSTREGWSIFIHPSGGYSFEYPTEWNIEVQKNRNSKDDMYRVSVRYMENGKKYFFYFMTGGRGGPSFDYEKQTFKTFGNRTISWNKMYQNDIPFEAVVSFSDIDIFEEYFIALYVYLPQTNQEKYENLIDQLVASIQLKN